MASVRQSVGCGFPRPSDGVLAHQELSLFKEDVVLMARVEETRSKRWKGFMTKARFVSSGNMMSSRVRNALPMQL